MLFKNELYDSIQRSFFIKTKVSIFVKMQFSFPPVLTQAAAAPPCALFYARLVMLPSFHFHRKIKIEKWVRTPPLNAFFSF